MAIKQILRGRLSASGETMAEARDALDSKIDSALKGYYEPFLVTHNHVSAIVYRDLASWRYKFLDREELSRPGVNQIYGTYAFLNRDDAIEAAAFAVINHGAALYEIRDDKDIPSWLTNQEQREILLKSQRFYRAYSFIKQASPKENEIVWHRWAIEHQDREEFR